MYLWELLLFEISMSGKSQNKGSSQGCGILTRKDTVVQIVLGGRTSFLTYILKFGQQSLKK
jgi:hypothetical protein